MMLLKALDAAKEDLDILKIKNPAEYLEWDDYTTWSRLLTSPKSREIIKALSERRLLKCAYERTFFCERRARFKRIYKRECTFESRGEIAAKAGVPTSDVGIDVPSLPSVPYHYDYKSGQTTYRSSQKAVQARRFAENH